MSGFFLGAPTSLATAAVAPPGDRGARSRPDRPALALLLSGGLHGAALALFLLATARSGLEEVPTRIIRVLVDPPIHTIRVAPDPTQRVAPPGRRTPKGGIVVPVDEVLTVNEILEHLPGIDPGPMGRTPTGPRDALEGSGDPPPAYTPPGDPDLPSQYQEPPVPIVAPEPRYPDFAREAGIEGRVVVVALVARDGRVLQARVQEGDQSLAEEALKAVRVWKFRPARWNGKPVAAWVAIPILFRLH